MRTVARGSLGILTISIVALSCSALISTCAGADTSSNPDTTPGSITRNNEGAGQPQGLQRHVNGLIPLGQLHPHSEPLERSAGSQPYDTTEAGLNLSNNWS